MSPYSGVFLDLNLGKKAASLYKKRRKALLKTLPGPALLKGIPHGPGAEHPWATLYAPVYQDPHLLHLTGINQANIALILDPRSQDCTLFLPEKNRKKEFWEGKELSIDPEDPAHNQGIKTLTGIENLRPISELKTEKKAATITNKAMAKQIWPQRLSLDKEQLHCTKEAIKKTNAAFKALLPQINTLKSETQVAGTLIGNLCKESPHGLSFSPIVAQGENAQVLHYTKNDSPLKKGNLLLLDFGLRWHSSVTDISRTLPISGRFSPLQALVYSICLEAQAVVEKNAKAGIPITKLNDLCWAHINKEIQEKIIDKGGKATLPYDKAPHFVSHAIGIQVHDGDPKGSYRKQPLLNNMIISNEPGIYGDFELKIAGKQYKEKIGIRIEDMLLIKKNSCKNLSKSIPKSITAIEKAMA